LRSISLNPVVPAIKLECMRRVSQNSRDIAKVGELHQRLPLIGWREWIALPDLEVSAIKAKIDTGARTSSLHAFDVSEFRRGKSVWLRFSIAPTQRSLSNRIVTEAPLVEYRSVRSSSGHQSHRPVIRTTIQLGDMTWSTEITLSSRDEMGFRMLIGRQTLANRFMVDSGKSFLASERS
jgi:hypothetical protein